ncbi:MAG: hypothetical protein A2360_02645 [Candidatus Staskawiczbacteria bacterium RIFOXYB1_FULL_32_11]|uniref:Uncharacterized protein n=1 Tax=Candidatus Staskawiczbacteria bacterium RIFOXYD1_FULL_32_13 TaxID=1802234 RepID=A0A1G2JK37_9BACT|nr:MAG: hypothetical protein UR22_C0009G0039 [Parcubacteria group bacterium GW2011_GWC2_32_10]OGZ78029.1 MAG: hypothetical protein A2360_02645 [Candidatus Staskawiczbacteria bacterium RIFOXYB1_FULL_32_11]OGZ79799.1 MAG: hypothetical protein A2256_00680 [Candidatus Staskawiczbacteria bacterium RIFOXYA2_FULL_32_7]OGZ87497.1 MAG: hypothetical protein A2561_00705 [Candidatus Staskawiczbacteria bacterium RIFOXYD1_FULL_32_13]
MPFDIMTLPEKREDLPQDPGILAKLSDVQSLLADLNSERQELACMVEKFQSSCIHKYVAKFVHDEDYPRVSGHYGMKVYVGQTCSRCKEFVPRRNGPRWEVCHACGGVMAHKEVVPGQGSRLHVYECKSCGHETTHS